MNAQKWRVDLPRICRFNFGNWAKISNDPNFEEKFWDVMGLYLDPPERALVLCCDEKSQCQALERTQRALPLKKGYSCYSRTQIAALSYLEGKIISQTEESHTHVERQTCYRRVITIVTDVDKLTMQI